MPIHIRELEDIERGIVVLRVEGEITPADALILSKIANEALERHSTALEIDLSDLHFLDSESAPTLLKLAQLPRIEFKGQHVFLQRIIEEAERDS